MDANVFGHMANVLFGLAYLVKDILWLRLISIVACFIMVLFNYFVPAEPLWVAIYWNIAFIAVNAVRSILLLTERNQARFSDIEKEMYDTVFHLLTPVEFAKLLRSGSWETFAPNTSIIQEGERPEALVLLYNGVARVQRNKDNRSMELRDGAFIGEMSMVTNGEASANVVAESEIKAFTWPRASLEKLFSANPNLKSSFQAVIASDMAQKLRGA